MFIAMLRIFNCLPVTYTEEKKLANRFSHPVIISQFISTLTQIFIAVIYATLFETEFTKSDLIVRAFPV